MSDNANGNRVNYYAMGSRDPATNCRTVNLGITNGPIAQRRKEHDQARNRRYYELAALKSTRDDERVNKEYFKSIRLTMQDGPNQTEEFYLDPPPSFKDDQRARCKDLREWLLWLQKQEFVAPKGECSEIEKLPIPTSFAQWDPQDPTHRATRRFPAMYNTTEDDFGEFSIIEGERAGPGDYYTPLNIIQAVHKLWGGCPDLDPASCFEANRVVKAKEYYVERENGLLRRWRGKVFLNPPFGEWKVWTDKVMTELKRGKIEAMVIISNGQTVFSDQFQPIVVHSDAFLIPDRRIHFWGKKAAKDAPRQGTFIYYIGRDTDGFDRHFSHLGWVCYRSKKYNSKLRFIS